MKCDISFVTFFVYSSKDFYCDQAHSLQANPITKKLYLNCFLSATNKTGSPLNVFTHTFAVENVHQNNSILEKSSNLIS